MKTLIKCTLQSNWLNYKLFFQQFKMETNYNFEKNYRLLNLKLIRIIYAIRIVITIKIKNEQSKILFNNFIL